MAGHSIEADGYSAQIAGTGAGLRAVRWGERLLTETWEIEPGVKPPLSCGLVLSPWPNRTGDGHYTTSQQLKGRWLDTSFTDMADEAGLITHRLIAPGGSATGLWTDLNFPWVQAFTADPAHDQAYPGRGPAVAIEPMTAPPNALVTGIDLIELEPGQVWTGRWGLRYRE